MTRLPRCLPALFLACATAMPLMSGTTALAQPAADPATPTPAAPAAPAADPAATATPATAAPAAVNADAIGAAEDFWHYARIARYDQATQAGGKLAAMPAEDILGALEQVTAPRHEDALGTLLSWQQVPEMKDVSTQLIAKVREGFEKIHLDPAFINKQIERLSVNERAFSGAVGELRSVGEVAVPFMLEYLRAPAKREFHPAIRRALIEMGRMTLNPLVAATEMKNNDEALMAVISVLGNIGYADAAPYLARLAQDKETGPAVKSAVNTALTNLGATDAAKRDAASQFLDLGEKFYYGSSSITADNRRPVAFFWMVDEAKGGLIKQDVPHQIFNDLMAQRAAEYTLKLDASKANAVSLWLSANYKAEVDLPQGQANPAAKDRPNAMFFGTAAGTQYLNEVLARALRDHNAPVAVLAIRSLATIAGPANLYGQQHKPIIDALSYPDRLVRTEAAMALAGGLPQQKFESQDLVVPILAESLGQSGKPNALLLSAGQDQFNQLSEQIKGAGYGVSGGTSAEAALAAASSLASVDVIVIDTTSTQGGTIDRAGELFTQNVRLARTPRLMITGGKAGPYWSASVDNPLVNATTARDSAGLTPALQSARQRGGAMPLNEQMALAYALKSADLLSKLAISRGQVLNVADAQSTLLGTLDDARPEIVKAAASVLALINSKESQNALAAKAADEKTGDEIKVGLLQAAAQNARFFGNQLEQSNVDGVRKLVESSANAEVKNAAAAALGALNLPVDQVKALIVNQSKVK